MLFGSFTLLTIVSLRSQNHNTTSFKLTTIYGLTRGNLKDAFFVELVSEIPPLGSLSLVTGDFNQIYRARDKNRTNVDQSRIVQFRNALNTCELKEINLQNRRFTWSNGQSDPILSKLDGFFRNEDGIWSLVLTFCMHSHLPYVIIVLFYSQMQMALSVPSASTSRTSVLRCPVFWQPSRRHGMKITTMSRPTMLFTIDSGKLASS